MRLDNTARAAKLCSVLAGLDLHLSHTECLEVISKIERDSVADTQATGINDDQRLAEQYLDELLEGIFEENYLKFTRRFEEKYLVLFPEAEFKDDIRNRAEDVGDYLHRQFMGCLQPKPHPDNLYPDHVRYYWRCFFEKNEVLIRVGIYHKLDTYFVSGAGTL